MANRHELEGMTKDELIAYADDRDIDVHHNWLKEDIISAILKGEKAAAKQEAKSAGAEVAESDEQHPKVDPKLAANQELAQKLPDEATRFAPKAPEKEE